MHVRRIIQLPLCILLLLCTACKTSAPPAPTSHHLSSDFLKKQPYRLHQPKGKIKTTWQPAEIDLGKHTARLDIPAHWPKNPHMRVTKRDGKSIEFYPPNGNKSGSRITIAHIQTQLSPEAFAATDIKRLEVFCGKRNTRGHVIQKHIKGVTAMSLCGRMGGATGISTRLNSQGEVVIYRLQQAPGGIYKIAHHWPGNAFDVYGDETYFPAAPHLMQDHSSALIKTTFCDSRTKTYKHCG